MNISVLNTSVRSELHNGKAALFSEVCNTDLKLRNGNFENGNKDCVKFLLGLFFPLLEELL